MFVFLSIVSSCGSDDLWHAIDGGGPHKSILAPDGTVSGRGAGFTLQRVAHEGKIFADSCNDAFLYDYVMFNGVLIKASLAHLSI